MIQRPPKSRWVLPGLILIAVLISLLVLFRSGALSRIFRPESRSRAAASSPEVTELQLTRERPVLSLPDHVASIRIEPPESGAGDLILSVCGDVILSEKVGDSPTTDWFFLANDRDSLILTGAINCAVWEFSDTNGNITVITDEHTFLDMGAVDISNYSYSPCLIPDGAVQARVTFRDDTLPYEATDPEIFIYYGKILEGYTDKSVTLPLPELSKNQAVVWEDGIWTLREGNQVIRQLDLADPGFSAGDILKMEGEEGGTVTVCYYEEESRGEMPREGLGDGQPQDEHTGEVPPEGLGNKQPQDKQSQDEHAGEAPPEGLGDEQPQDEYAGEAAAAPEENDGAAQNSHTGETAPEESPDLTAEYGIRHSLDSGISVCERLGDARGAHFDFLVEDEWQNGGVNDFDRFYPWSEMRLCNISVHDGKREFIYEDDPRFSLDGSSGNVMVEIPKFYVKRTVADGYEEVWISGVRHDGYEIEPVFVKSGKELEHVYISAYLGSVSTENAAGTQSEAASAAAAGDPAPTETTTAAADPDSTETAAAAADPAPMETVAAAGDPDAASLLAGKRLVSVSGEYPEIRVPYSDLLEIAKNNGEGFSEINFLMYQALQKLFLVEAGSLDCSSLIRGYAKAYFYYPPADDDTTKVCLALESARQTNTVKLKVTSMSKKLVVGTSIILLDLKNGWEAYNDGGTTRCREIISKNKDKEEGVVTLTLDGEPFDVTKGETVIASYPARTGQTDGLAYTTAVYHKNNGKHGFKYRGIENVYGTSLTLLDSDAFLIGTDFYFFDGNEMLQKISEPVPLQHTSLDASEQGFTLANVNCIRRMSYDTSHPTVMVPVECEVSSYNYYGDYWFYRPKTFGDCYYLAVGGAYDNERLCGIFQMRGVFTSRKYAGNFHVGRIMYR